MKSIMQEASSVMKAIDTAWQAAGKPTEFTVKVFEEAEKNFIGFTTKPAKIALFFQAPAAPHQRRSDDARFKQRPRQQDPKRDHQQSAPQQVKKQIQPSQTHPQPQRQLPNEAEQNVGPIWNNELIEKAREWMSGTLKAIGQTAPSFDVATDHYLLRLTINQSPFEDAHKEREFFRHSSFLLLCSLKRTFKRPLRGYKILITRP